MPVSAHVATLGVVILATPSAPSRCYAFPKMEAQLWTLIGVLIVLLVGAFYRVESRFDSQAARIDGRFDSQAARFDGAMSAMNARVDQIHSELHQVNRILLGHDRRFDAIDTRFDAVDARFDALESRLDDHIRRHAS